MALHPYVSSIMQFISAGGERHSFNESQLPIVLLMRMNQAEELWTEPPSTTPGLHSACGATPFVAQPV